jgi:hypothetical protein
MLRRCEDGRIYDSVMLGRIIAVFVCLFGAEAAQLPDLVIPEGFGLSISGGSDEDLDKMSAVGLKVARKDLVWESIERQKGVYDFATRGYDAFVERCRKRGIRIMFILDYSNRLYEPVRSVRTEEGRKAFAAWAKAAAEHYRGSGILWEIWNEPNFSTFWRSDNPPRFGILPTPASTKDATDYCNLVGAVAPVVHAADPTGLVIAPATSEIRLERGYEEQCFRLGLLQWIDAFSVHPYRKQPPETAVGDYAMLRLLMRDHGRELPIVQSEWGYSRVNWDGSRLSEETKAQYLVRMMLSSLYARVPMCLWYTLYDGRTKNERENGFGIVAVDRKPNLSYTAARVLNTTLKGYRFDRRLDLGLFTDNDFALRFVKDGSEAIAFWTTEEQHQVTLPISPGEGTLSGWLGDASPVSWTTDGLKVPISSSPQYLLINLIKR